MKPNDVANFEVFDYTHSQVTEEDITKKIWTLLENVSKKDIENRREELTNNKKIILS